MRRIAIAVTTLGLLLAAAPAASAAVCTREEAVVELEAPSHVNAGKPFPVTITSSALAGQVSGATLTVGDAATPVEIPEFDVLTTRPRAPRRLGRLTIGLTWQQSGNGAAPCEGRATVTVTVLKASLKIGDLSSPRVDGRWRIAVTPINVGTGYESFTRPVTSRCDVGACPFAFGTPREGAVALTLNDDGLTYTRESPQSARPRYECVNARTREVIVRNAYFEQITWRLKVIGSRRTASGALQARRISGVITRVVTPTGEARRRNCPDGAQRYRVVMTRR